MKKMGTEYSIMKVESRTLYEGLRDLWCRVFGDEAEFVDAMYGAFSADIAGYVVTDPAGKVVSALTCYRCGTYRAEDFGYDRTAADASAEHPKCAEDVRNADSPYEMFASLDGMPVYVSYAVCTDPDYRGLGLAGKLTEYVRDLVTAMSPGGISLVSPAEPSLIRFYQSLGYEPHFYADELIASSGDPEDILEDITEDSLTNSLFKELISGPYYGPSGKPFYDPADSQYDEAAEEGSGDGSDRARIYEWGEDDDDFEAFDPGLDVLAVDAETYNRYREEFLAGRPHVELTRTMLEFIRAESLGGDGLLLINGGDAICTLTAASDNLHPTGILAAELLVNPMLKEISAEIDEELAAKLAEHFGTDSLVFRTPGHTRCQSMIATGHTAEIGTAGEPGNGLAEKNASVARPYDPYEVPHPAYFGFPID